MNKERRNKIAGALAMLQDARDGEQAAFDNLPETFQAGQQGERLEQNVEQLDQAIESLEAIE